MSKLNLGLIWGVITTTVATVVWMFTNFASAAEVQELKTEIAYGQYYDRLDDYDEAVEEGNEELAEEHAEQMERLIAKICEEDPEWRRCRERSQ